MEIVFDFKNALAQMEKASEEVKAKWNAEKPKIMHEAAKATIKTARKYSPISPTQQVINRNRKTKRVVKRKDSATSRSKPGVLMNSIATESDSNKMVIFVPSNVANAGLYAKKIHDEKGITWQNRGPGTVAKGPQADEKFIERAIDNHKKNGDYETLVKKAIARAVK